MLVGEQYATRNGLIDLYRVVGIAGFTLLVGVVTAVVDESISSESLCDLMALPSPTAHALSIGACLRSRDAIIQPFGYLQGEQKGKGRRQGEERRGRGSGRRLGLQETSLISSTVSYVSVCGKY